MTDLFLLSRFVEAQKDSYATGLAELRQGRKRTHWIWYVFPQLKGLGHSSTAQYYGIASLAEAQAYLRHPVLGSRLIEATHAVIDAPASTLQQLLGTPDDLKFRSSMTLFLLADEAASETKLSQKAELFQQAIDRWCGCELDEKTIDLLHGRPL